MVDCDNAFGGAAEYDPGLMLYGGARIPCSLDLMVALGPAHDVVMAGEYVGIRHSNKE